MNQNFYIDKIFHFPKGSDWKLPRNEEIYTHSKWVIESLQKKKEALNLVKAQLSDFDLDMWSKHTKRRDPSSTIIANIRQHIKPELLTQAWCKFYECLATFNLVEKEGHILRSVHLCEAPGAFISALNHFVVNNYSGMNVDWLANSYNPRYQGNDLDMMIPDDRLIKYTEGKWMFGADLTGDITQYYNYLAIKLVAGKRENALVTADGSVNCMSDPGEQENRVSYLHYCEMLTALSVLKKGGNFVIKIFTIFEESTVCYLYLLNCVFQSVSVFKPLTSKSGNSELYVVCKNYTHIGLNTFTELLKYYQTPELNKAMFSYNHIPIDFINFVHECVDFFMLFQTQTINENIKYFQADSEEENERLQSYHTNLLKYFFQKCYMLQRIPYSKKIINRDKLIPNFFCNHDYTCYFKRYSDKNERWSINCKVGKKVEKFRFSRFCPPEKIKQLVCARNRSKGSLVLQCIDRLFLETDTLCLNVIDFATIYSVTDEKNFSDFDKKIVYKIIPALCTDKDLLLIDVPVLTNFMAGLLYILGKGYENVNFFKGGIIYLTRPKTRVQSKIKEDFCELQNVFIECGKQSHNYFDCDILEVLEGDFSLAFLKCLWFYNFSF